jgi:plastocyanin
LVPRLLRAAGRICPRYAGITAFGLLLLWPAPAAHALNTRVSIANYAWAQPRVEVNRGEKVTWDWLGPDLAHSITGISPNAVQWDSDTGNDAPAHRAGDTFTVQFDTPGEYFFQCKLHAAVRGEVIVSDAPGDPDSDPGPQPPLNLDLRPPTLGSLALAKQSTKGHEGIAFSAQVSERGRLDAEYYRLDAKGKRTYSGYETWKTFIGINHLRLGARWKHFRARPGRYLAVLRATDEAANESKSLRKRFTISG